MSNGIVNELFKPDESNEYTIMYLGQRKSGKTTLIQRVFEQLPENHVNLVRESHDVKVLNVQSFRNIKIIDIPGHREYLFDIPDEHWSLSVEEGGLDLPKCPEDSRDSRRSNCEKTIGVIFVIDAQDSHDYPNNMVTAMDSMIEAAKKLYSVYGNHLNFEVFLNKTDLLNDDQCAEVLENAYIAVEDLQSDERYSDMQIPISPTTVFDHSIFDSTSKTLQKLIIEQPQLEKLLNLIISNGSVHGCADKAYIFDVRTRLYIATDSINNSELTMLDICSGMIEMVDGIYRANQYDYSRGDEEEEVASVFDENTESWVTMNNNILTCLIGITPSLALVCVLRDEVQKFIGPFKHNLLIFRNSIQEMLEMKH